MSVIIFEIIWVHALLSVVLPWRYLSTRVIVAELFEKRPEAFQIFRKHSTVKAENEPFKIYYSNYKAQIWILIVMTYCCESRWVRRTSRGRIKVRWPQPLPLRQLEPCRDLFLPLCSTILKPRLDLNLG